MSRPPRHDPKPSPFVRGALVAGLAVAVAGYVLTQAGGESPDESWQAVELEVDGLDCAFWCSVKVADAIDGLEGATVDTVDPGAGRVAVRYDPSRRAVADLVQAVESRGFAVTATRETGSRR